MTLRVHPDEIVRNSSSALLRIHDSWERVRLSDVADVLNGFAFKSAFFDRVAGVPLLRIRDISRDGTDTRYTGGYDPMYLVEHGELVIGMDGDFRVARWSGPTALLNQRVCKVSIRDPELYEPHLLLYVLPGYLDAVHAHTSSVTVKHLSSRTVQDLPLPLPPLNEQRRIVAAIEEQLSRLDAAAASLATASRRLSRLQDGVYATATDGDWPVIALGDLSERITKGTTPTSLGHRFTQDGVLFVKAESLVDGVIDHARCAHIDESTHDVLARSQLAENDVLVTIAGTLGRVGVVRAADLPANTNQAVSLTRLREPALAPWVATWLNTRRAKTHLAAGGRGVGLQNLNLKQIAEVPVAVPPLEEQRRIVAEVEERLSVIDAMRASIERAQRRSAALRRSILERAFRGELVPQDPSDEPASVLLDRIRAERAAAEPTRHRPSRMGQSAT